MLVVISDAMMLPDEAAWINALLDEGLAFFHLRKPSTSASDLHRLLQNIQPEHLDKVALHQHHHLAATFGIKRLHFTEADRVSSNAGLLQQLKEEGSRLSTSIHTINDAAALQGIFDYAFFGPVFNSISKKGYNAAVPESFQVDAGNLKLIALGGIDANNCTKALQMGFAGVAVLGAIWQADDPVKSFRQISNAYRSCMR